MPWPYRRPRSAAEFKAVCAGGALAALAACRACSADSGAGEERGSQWQPMAARPPAAQPASSLVTRLPLAAIGCGRHRTDRPSGPTAHWPGMKMTLSVPMIAAAATPSQTGAGGTRAHSSVRSGHNNVSQGVFPSTYGCLVRSPLESRRPLQPAAWLRGGQRNGEFYAPCVGHTPRRDRHRGGRQVRGVARRGESASAARVAGVAGAPPPLAEKHVQIARAALRRG